jgi:hypothetical protein
MPGLVRGAGQLFDPRREMIEVNFVPVPPPTAAPAVRVDQARGQVDAGKHEYVVTFITEMGETQSGPIGAKAIVTQSNSMVLGNNVDVGIGTSAPVLVGTPGQGIVLKSPDGATCRLLSIDNQGSLQTAPIRCP